VLRKHWAPPKYFYHLRKGGHLGALQLHAHDGFFAVLDIEGFFGSITKNKIARTLKSIGFAWQDAMTVAHRSCVQEGAKRILPFGYVQSPMLASIVLNKSALGLALEATKKQGLNVSVFMDDIILSHPDNPDLVGNALTTLNKAADTSHFHFSAEKSQAVAENVRAFNIILSNESLEISQNRFEEFARTVLQAGDSAIRSGILGYVAQVNTAQYDQLAQLTH
jgi:hypothetical protein